MWVPPFIHAPRPMLPYLAAINKRHPICNMWIVSSYLWYYLTGGLCVCVFEWVRIFYSRRIWLLETSRTDMNSLTVIGVSTWIICIIGLIGNVIAFCTFGKMSSQNSSTILLRFLAFVDSCLLFLILLEAFETTFLATYLSTWWSYVTGHCILPTLFSMTRTATIWTPVLVGLHRYIAVCKPLSASRMCTMRNARVQFVCVLAFSVIVNFPQFFSFKIVEITTNQTDANSFYIVDMTTMARSPWFHTGYFTVTLICLINYVVPVVLLVFITMALLQSLHLYRQQRTVMREGQSEIRGQDERKVDVMVIVVLIVFIMCHTGYPVAAIVLMNPTNSLQGLATMLYASFTVLTTFSSSVNCFIYITFNRKFRQILCHCTNPTFASQES